MNKSGEIDPQKEALQALLDQVTYGRIDRRTALRALGVWGLAAVGLPGLEEAFAAGETQKKLAANPVDTFDVIVIGGGSAGAVVAARASENPHRKVLLLEAGPTDEGVASIANPLIWFTNIQSAYDWKYGYTPQEAVRQRTILIPRGKVLGGSSSINALIWVRGAPSDFDHWARSGAAGWGWADVLPYYKKAEDWQMGASTLRGAHGPLRCELPSAPHPIAVAVVEAAKSLGLPAVEDVNGAIFGGASLANLNIKDGTRHNTARAYLRPAMSRPNLTVLTQAQALRLVFEGTRCRGVKISVDGTSRVVRARHEVVLSAGAIDTPRLLLLSGVGDPQELRRLGIPVVAEVKGVGKNLHDHPLLMGVNFEAATTIAPFRNNCGGSQAFWSSDPSTLSGSRKLIRRHAGPYAARQPRARAPAERHGEWAVGYSAEFSQGTRRPRGADAKCGFRPRSRRAAGFPRIGEAAGEPLRTACAPSVGGVRARVLLELLPSRRHLQDGSGLARSCRSQTESARFERPVRRGCQRHAAHHQRQYARSLRDDRRARRGVPGPSLSHFDGFP